MAYASTFLIEKMSWTSVKMKSDDLKIEIHLTNIYRVISRNCTKKFQNKHELFEAHFELNRLTSNNNLMTVLVGNETRTVTINPVRPEWDKNNHFSTTKTPYLTIGVVGTKTCKMFNEKFERMSFWKLESITHFSSLPLSWRGQNVKSF